MKIQTSSILLFLLLLLTPCISIAQEENLEEMLLAAKAKKEDVNHVNLLVNISDSLFRKDPIKAIEYATDAHELAKKLNYSLGSGNALKYIGMGHFTLGDYVMAVNYFQQALEVYEAIDYKVGISNMLNNLGVIYNNQGNDSKALEHYLKSLKLSEETNDTIRYVTALINIGLVYSKKEATLDQAVIYYMRALPICERIGYLDAIGTISVNLGDLHYNKGDYKTALRYFEQSLSAFQKSNSGNVPYSLINIGKIYTIWKDYDNALKHQYEALKIAQSRSAKLEVAQALLGIANVYAEKGEYYKALDNYHKSEQMAKEIGALYELLATYDGIASAYSGLENFKKAFEYKAIAFTLKDTVYSVASQLQISQMQIQSEIESMLKENEILKRDVQIKAVRGRQQSILIVFLMFGIVLIIFFLIFLFRSNNHKKRVNAELSEKNALITYQKQSITDSILYASRIQNALLTPEEQISTILPEHFILFKPRDIVSGDFYWLSNSNGRIICIAADCTGHGVPGAFMSMLGISFLNEIISRNPEIKANEILNEMRRQVVSSLRQGGKTGGNRDGMDVSLLIFDRDKKQIEFAGANNPLILIRNNETIDYKPDKMPIGYYVADEKPFTNHVIDVQKGDMLYLFSDGFIDQFGGGNGRKFMIKNFRSLLLDVHNKEAKLQRQVLEQRLYEWMDGTEQIDDILVMGIRV
jgi:serine phosphatase RsbU (regulator of sigma subunit)